MKTNIQAFGHQILEIVPSNVKVTLWLSSRYFSISTWVSLHLSPVEWLFMKAEVSNPKPLLCQAEPCWLHYCRMMGKVNKLVVGVENVNTASTGAWEASCWYSCDTVQYFYLCFRDLSNVGFDWDRRVARVRMTGFRRNLPPFDQLTPDAVNLQNGKI